MPEDGLAYLTLWSVPMVWSVWYVQLYEHSTCRYVRLNALNVLHVHGPRFNAPSQFLPVTTTSCFYTLFWTYPGNYFASFGELFHLVLHSGHVNVKTHLLCISTSFQVLAAPESRSKYSIFLRQFTKFCNSSKKRLKSLKNCWKMLKK